MTIKVWIKQIAMIELITPPEWKEDHFAALMQQIRSNGFLIWSNPPVYVPLVNIDFISMADVGDIQPVPYEKTMKRMQ